MRLMRLTVLALFLLPTASARASSTVHYGSLAKDFAVVHEGGSTPLLLMHEASHTYEETENIANALQGDGFTVLNLEWDEATGTRVWGHDVGQIEEAVRYVQAHIRDLGVDATHLTMLGGSRGANLALLTSMDMNAAVPGTVKAIASLSGDANPAKQIERGQHGELDKGVAGKLSKAYGCEPVLLNCPTDYVERWSPIAKASGTAPAMFLAASEGERKTASLADEYELAAKLGELGVAAEVLAPPEGHAFTYWRLAHKPAVAFLVAHS